MASKSAKSLALLSLFLSAANGQFPFGLGKSSATSVPKSTGGGFSLPFGLGASSAPLAGATPSAAAVGGFSLPLGIGGASPANPAAAPVGVPAAAPAVAGAAGPASGPDTGKSYSASVQNACTSLKSALPAVIVTEKDAAYQDEMKDYWSAALRENRPACIALPSKAEDVSQVVKALSQFPDVRFAVKSGGHDPNPGHAAIHDGVLIAMKRMKGTTNDAAKGVAYVLPGGRWNDVIGALEKDGVTVVGGRLGVVGLGGFLTQGGISFLSAQHGMASDSVLGYETVFPNGSIINVTPETHPDLMVAMRGAGSQFGVVTKFTLKTYKMGQVWGGYRLYLNPTDQNAFYTGLGKFISNYANTPKAAIIVSRMNPTTILVHYFYDGPSPPPGTFSGLEDIPSTFGTTAEKKYSELLGQNGFGADLLGQRTSFRSMTLSYPKSRPTIFAEIIDLWNNITAAASKAAGGAVDGTIAIQPYSNVIAKASAAKGGNAMGLSASDPDRFIIEISCLWNDKKFDSTVYSMSKQLTDQIEAIMASTPDGKGYNPLFMNDAAFDQNVFASYKDAAKFKALQSAADPQGMFLKRSNGFSMQ